MMVNMADPGGEAVTQDRFVSVRAAWMLSRVSFLEKLVYRFDLVMGLFGTLITILVFRHLWISLYGEREMYAGATLNQTLTYTALSIIATRIYPNRLIHTVAGQLRTGDIIFDITRPMHYGSLLFYQTMGQAMATIVTTSLPMFALVYTIMRVTLPSSALVWAAFLVSWSLGFCVSFFIDFITSLLGFWTTGMNGIFFAKNSLVSILSGEYIPLWIFPPVLEQILSFLPFYGANYVPMSISVSKIGPDRILSALMVQFIWVAILAAASRWCYGPD
jgi:ABC-2 type transport system permease protein